MIRRKKPLGITHGQCFAKWECILEFQEGRTSLMVAHFFKANNQNNQVELCSKASKCVILSLTATWALAFLGGEKKRLESWQIYEQGTNVTPVQRLFCFVNDSRPSSEKNTD